MIKKIIYLVVITIFLYGCAASTQQKNIVNFKLKNLAIDSLSKDITSLLKNIYSPAKTNIVLNVRNNEKFNESLQTTLRSVGYSIREIIHNEAEIYSNELKLEYIVDKIRETAEEKRIKKINHDTSTILRVSIIINNKMYNRLYKIYKSNKIVAISRWLEIKIN